MPTPRATRCTAAGHRGTGRRSGGDGWADALRYGGFTMLGKFAQLIGVGRYLRGRLGGKRQALMEYK